MQGKTHALIGVTAGLWLAVQTAAPVETALLYAGLGALGGLLPDIDHPNSSISRRLPPLRLFTFWMPHRTYTHSLFAVVLVMFAGITFAGFQGAALAMGYMMHVVADMMTFSGVPILIPVSRARWHLLPRFFRIDTGGMTETMLAVAVIAVNVYLSGLLFGVV